MSETLVALLATTVVVSGLLTWVVRNLALRLQLLDPLTPRSQHSQPTPRLGGVAIAVSALAGWLAVRSLVGSGDDWSRRIFVLGAILAAATGLIDDLLALGPAAKLIGQLIAVLPGVVWLAPTLPPGPPALSIAIWTFLAVGYMNLNNFMDGSDGLAAGVAIINALVLAVLVWPAQPALFVLVLGASVLGFLWFNYPPASVFMGDAGSLFLGYGVAMTGTMMVAAGHGAWPIGLALSPFAFDGTLTLLSRLARGERVWLAHRSHLYQRLLVAGWTPWDVARLYWGWAMLAGTAGVVYQRAPGWPQVTAMAATTAAALAVVWAVRVAERRSLGA